MKELSLKISVVSLAVAIVIAGFFIYKGLRSFADKERIVTVRGLSERIVNVDNANLVISYAVGGNEMSEVLKEIEQNNKKIKDFVIAKGLTEKEISVNVPNIKDKKNQEYGGEYNITYRYYATVKITLISNKVSIVRDIEMNQFDLFKEGVNLIKNDYYYEGENNRTYSFTKLNDIKPDMIKESIKNAKKAADEFAQSSNSKIKNIKSAYQGQFEITSTDDPLKVKVRVVSTINYFVK
ncbi:MAG: SIMPL domain-containing protein [Synergistales bacterium]|nr:SIMPL domain-containing protein [Bacteroidales bacterium]MDY6424493.1 SIMPL domain-containing protein [Bacteroidales bacterium]MDY6434925.1 SIMPL domain-containing protein [Synergistales bacterium]